MSHQLTLEATVFTKAQITDALAPQIAFAGRSNVGKSSLINALSGRKQLAKTSATPGKTRSINYYKIDSGPYFLVDLPGYGYARCSQEERNKWADLLDFYLKSTPGLAALALLIDSRHEPQRLDIELARYAISLGLPLLPLLTKADKCNKKTLDACKKAWKQLLPQYPVLLTSAEKKQGLEAVWTACLEILVRKEGQLAQAVPDTSGEEAPTPDQE